MLSLRPLVPCSVSWLLAAVLPAQVVLEAAPLPGDGRIVFDRGRGHAVLITKETWSWDGSKLRLISTLAPPAGVPIYSNFEGVELLDASSASFRLWRMDSGTTWLEEQVAGSSPPSAFNGEWNAAYDIARNRIVLFIGGGRQETWEWDGANWIRRVPPAAPGTTKWFTMAYDAMRARTVLIGGAGTGNQSEIWEWDGSFWQMVFLNPIPFSQAVATYHPGLGEVVTCGGTEYGSETATMYGWNGAQLHPVGSLGSRPGHRREHSVAYDSKRNLLLVFGGETTYPGVLGKTEADVSDLWAWDASSSGTWSFEMASDPGGPRRAPPAADPLRGEIVLFGGQFRGGALSDTWTWDGVLWRERFPKTPTPLGRYGHAMTTDTARSVVLMFGGSTTWNIAMKDTWAWNGSDWTLLASTGPSPRDYTAMAHHGGTGRTILFGGQSFNMVVGDTWSWDGRAWTQLFPANNPPPRAVHAMAYDRHRDVIVLFGGDDLKGVFFYDTWEWDGRDWTQRTTTTAPTASATREVALAYDDFRERIVASADLNNPSVGAWEWDGVDWSPRFPQSAPVAGAQLRGALGYDHLRRRIVATSGGSATFEYHSAAEPRADIFGVPCSGGGTTPWHAAIDLPWTDDVYQLALFGVPASSPTALLLGSSRLSLGSVPLPLSLSNLGAFGCSVYTSSDFAVPLTAAAGAAYFSLPIPANSALIGGQFHTQGLLFDPAANPAGVLLTNGLTSTVGAR
jgi:hypothetical protein